jgi:hypothetical protein
MIDVLNVLPMILFRSALIVSLIVFIYLVFNPDKQDRFVSRHEKLSGFVFFGAFGALFIVLLLGFKELLSFIPDTFGSDDKYGNFRNWLTYVLAGGLSIFVAYLFGKGDTMREENLRLRISIEVQKRKMDLQKLDQDLLFVRQVQMQDRLEKLQERSNDQGLSTAEKEESEVLDELITEAKKLRISIEVRKGKMDLRKLNQDSLFARQVQMQDRLEKLQERSNDQRLSTEEEEESQVLDKLITEAEKRLQKIK